MKLSDLISIEQKKMNRLCNIFKDFVVSAADVIV
jgi:hypothetical protein